MSYIDCIHYGVCTFYDEKCTEQCVRFKDIANFVEIVRCKDCAIPHNEMTGCPKLNGLIPGPEHFCGYGVRKEKRNDTN